MGDRRRAPLPRPAPVKLLNLSMRDLAAVIDRQLVRLLRRGPELTGLISTPARLLIIQAELGLVPLRFPFGARGEITEVRGLPPVLRRQLAGLIL